MLGRVLGAAAPNFLTTFSGRTSQYLSTRERKRQLKLSTRAFRLPTDARKISSRMTSKNVNLNSQPLRSAAQVQN